MICRRECVSYRGGVVCVASSSNKSTYVVAVLTRAKMDGSTSTGHSFVVPVALHESVNDT
jgi:hypothetical protein